MYICLSFIKQYIFRYIKILFTIKTKSSCAFHSEHFSSRTSARLCELIILICQDAIITELIVIILVIRLSNLFIFYLSLIMNKINITSDTDMKQYRPIQY